MNKVAEINRLLNLRFDKSPVQVWPAVVKSVQGRTCTVDIQGTELVDVPGVQLQADEDSTEGVLFTPRVGSFVYISAIENSLDNLYICCFSEVDQVEMAIGDVSLTMDENGITLLQDQSQIELSQGKVSIKNAGVSLKDLFTDLTSLINSLKTITPVQGVPTLSTSLDPGTVSAISQLTTKVDQLLA